MLNPGNHVFPELFTIDCYSQICPENAENTNYFQRTIASTQLRDGSFIKYSGRFQGGDISSTLWCTKILLNYSPKLFMAELGRAFSYLINRMDIAATDASQIGLLGVLLLRHGRSKYLRELGKVVSYCLRYLRRIPPKDGSPADLMGRLYLIECLLEYYSVSGSKIQLRECERHLEILFGVDEPTDGLPLLLASLKQRCVESLFFQILARVCVAGLKYCRIYGSPPLALKLNNAIHNNYRKARNEALTAQASFREFLEIYGPTQHEFSRYDNELAEALQKQRREKTIFVMMPFRDHVAYDSLARAIKVECEKKGFRAIRPDDDDRQFSEILWDNLVINMLSCKYAIAIYVSDPIFDKMENRVLSFASSNVALEFGFFKSRGQEILILKDKRSELPSDLRGFLWHEFDMAQPDRSISGTLQKWLDRIAADDTQHNP